jgi:hypothetical protein
MLLVKNRFIATQNGNQEQKNTEYMRYHLIRQFAKQGYLIRPACSTGLMMLLFFLKVHAWNNFTDNQKYKDTVKPASSGLPGNVTNDEFKKKALAKIKEFQNCLTILCDRHSGNVALDNAVDQAVSLFIDGAIIEVSSIHSSEKKHLKVRDFLEKFRNLRYDNVVITFSHVDYVSNIRKGPDGNYYGLVSFEQTFRAYSDGRVVYEDETKKTTEVQLVVYERSLHGNAVQQWDVMLSDVEVLGTKTPKRN